MLEIMFLLLGFSFLVISSPALRANETMDKWLDQIESSIFGGIFQLAYYSPKEALDVLIKYFYYVGWGTLIPQAIIMHNFGLVSNLLLYTSSCLLYTSFSLFTWVMRREEVFTKLTTDYIKTMKVAIKWSIALFSVAFIVYTSLKLEHNPQYIPEIEFIIYAFLGTLLVVGLSLGAMNIFLCLLLFLPAFISILYVVAVVYVAKFIAKTNRSSVKYAFVVYFVIASLYTFYLTYISLK
ncbi:hypothetical protein [Aliivibrio fischeri]|uniref:Uncharacterized protein n=1 Tax=Aliivibrio fischeri SR5 TaxID=1088719 RepID=A0AAV3EN28_ALIFS|nr:hypothetical protein [Aliivibrio fischeri]EHN68034.1 hypothetical protein VFSR5_A0615 [Aliivibrio fischeri SR5]MUL11892.1 hypothetical protein [Aliivibrio fischeri]MUL15530.1 hypothetical protein [Aliivibrio fischeri]